MARTIPLDEDFFPPFAGFPKEGLRFLTRLKKNNNRPWFQNHRHEYEEFVRFPMQCLIATLRGRMRDVAPELDFNPKRSIFRIYRDTRFSTDKTPYKTNVAASFDLKGSKGLIETPGLYLHIEPGGIYIGGGLYMPTGLQLKQIRARMVDDPESYLAVVGSRRFKKVFGDVEGEMLQRAPLGYSPDHPMIAHLRRKQFYTGVERPDTACLKPSFAATVERTFMDVLPLVRWLTAALK